MDAVIPDATRFLRMELLEVTGGPSLYTQTAFMKIKRVGVCGLAAFAPALRQKAATALRKL